MTHWYYGPPDSDATAGMRYHTWCGGTIIDVDEADVCSKCGFTRRYDPDHAHSHDQPDAGGRYMHRCPLCSDDWRSTCAEYDRVRKLINMAKSHDGS